MQFEPDQQRCFRYLNSYWNGTYKLIHFNRSSAAQSTFVAKTLRSFPQLSPGNISHHAGQAVQAPRGSLNLSLILFHVLCYTETYSQYTVVQDVVRFWWWKNLNIPGSLVSVLLMDFPFALLWKREKKKRRFTNQHWEGAFLLTEGVLVTKGVLALSSGPWSIKPVYHTGFENSYCDKS